MYNFAIHGTIDVTNFLLKVTLDSVVDDGILTQIYNNIDKTSEFFTENLEDCTIKLINSVREIIPKLNISLEKKNLLVDQFLTSLKRVFEIEIDLSSISKFIKVEINLDPNATMISKIAAYEACFADMDHISTGFVDFDITVISTLLLAYHFDFVGNVEVIASLNSQLKNLVNY